MESLKQKEEIEFLKKKSCYIREKYAEYVNHIGRSHVGGSFSMCEMVIALFYRFMNWDINDIENNDRDRFILSKGHCSELLYIIFSDMGWCNQEKLVEERLKIDGMCSGHANKRYIPMIEVGTGALGHGLPIAAGYAHACKADKKEYRVICLVGDGEMDEGANWESILYVAHNHLKNLILIVDRNLYSSCKKTDEIINLGELENKFIVFGWETLSIQGNNMAEVYNCLRYVFECYKGDKPIVIISNTTKGYGLEEAVQHPEEWHNRGISDEDLYRLQKGGVL